MSDEVYRVRKRRVYPGMKDWKERADWTIRNNVCGHSHDKVGWQTCGLKAGHEGDHMAFSYAYRNYGSARRTTYISRSWSTEDPFVTKVKEINAKREKL